VGSGWVHTYTRALTVKEYALVEMHRPDGKIYNFQKNAEFWTSDADVPDQLVELINSGGARTGWVYVTSGDEVESYDIVGKLLSITSRSGLTQTITYNCNTITAICPAMTPADDLMIRVSDTFGRQLNLTYDSSNRISSMTDPAGGLYTYVYGANNNLASVTYPDGATRTYLYENGAFPNTLSGIIDENGVRYVTYTYDANGRAVDEIFTAAGGNVNHYSIAYTLDDNGNPIASTVTDPFGTARIYNFDTIQGVSKLTGSAQPGGSGCGMAASDMSYDANGNVASRTDFNGNLTTYTYDLARNLETSRTEGLTVAGAKTSATRTINTTWDPVYRLAASITEQDSSGANAVTLRSTTFSYDASGNLIGKTLTDAQNPAASRTWAYTYDAVGHLLTADGPRTDAADITTYAYDAQGNLATVTNALNQVATLGGYDANGRAGTLTAPNGLVTQLTYDARGRLITRAAGSETTRYTYDGVGQLLTVTPPDGATSTYTYDAAHRLTGIADYQGNHISYTLDAMGNRTQEQILDSANNVIQTHSRVFDALNRLQQDIGAVNQITTYTYDANGNLTGIVAPLNRSTVNIYDALNRLITSVDPANGQTDYGYNALDQLTIVLDPRSLGTQYIRDGLDNLKQTVSPDTGITANAFDAAGNVLSRTDAKGQVSSYTYDALNRITGINYAGAPGLSVTYQYDQGSNGIGHLTGITDATGAIAYRYDTHGRLSGETDQTYGATYTTAYAHDAQGRLNSITYPSTRTINYTFDTLGRINRIATTFNGNTQVLASDIAYQPFGGAQSFTYGDGLTAPVQTYTRQHDQDGRIAGYTLNGKLMAVGQDAASQITSVSDTTNLSNTANYSYDPLSRLTGFSLGTTSQSFAYDADGNRTSQTLGAATSTYSYSADSNRLSGIQTGAATQTLTQDANGATTGDGSRQYVYDARGRLIQTTTAQGVINYEVNALGLRVRKQAPYANTDTVYHYDVQGRLIGESAAGSSHFTREYIYLGDQPVAVLQ
jgi:YD repeat-containing protein